MMKLRIKRDILDIILFLVVYSVSQVLVAISIAIWTYGGSLQFIGTYCKYLLTILKNVFVIDIFTLCFIKRLHGHSLSTRRTANHIGNVCRSELETIKI